MDSYIVRIYRHQGSRAFPARRAHDAVALTGVVENAASGEHRTFHDIEELWAILAAGKTPASGMTNDMTDEKESSP